MVRHRTRLYASVSLETSVVGALLMLGACAPPPCTCIIKSLPPSPQASCNGAQTGVPAAAPSALGQSGVQASSGARTILWDGDAEGAKAKGWADCKAKPACNSNLVARAGMGLNASVGLRLRGEGSDWIGGGWNFFGWWPADAGFDASVFRALSVAIRVEAKDKALAPDAATFMLYLKCSSKKEGCESQTLNVAKHTIGDLYDGAWHIAKFPLAEFTKDGFDLKTVSELDLNTWSRNRKEFTVYLDDISLTSD